MYNSGQTFSMQSALRPIVQQQFMNALMSRPFDGPVFSEMGISREAQTNALAQHGGPTVAAANSLVPGAGDYGHAPVSPLAPITLGSGFTVSPETRATIAPADGFFNISMDFNASPNGDARGTEVIIPDNSPPELRAAAEQYNALVADFARAAGIHNYPVRGVRTRSENGRGVSHTVHTEPFFNSDLAMQKAIAADPEGFAALYEQAFGHIGNARLIAPHGMGADKGAASSVFGSETEYGRLMANSLIAPKRRDKSTKEQAVASREAYLKAAGL